MDQGKKRATPSLIPQSAPERLTTNVHLQHSKNTAKSIENVCRNPPSSVSENNITEGTNNTYQFSKSSDSDFCDTIGRMFNEPKETMKQAVSKAQNYVRGEMRRLKSEMTGLKSMMAKI